jgi:hypothetical protein
LNVPAWITTFLQSIGAQATQANVEFLEAWANFEHGTTGGDISNNFNPLNIETLDGSSSWGGATGFFNPQGVLQFPDEDTGVSATIAWLQHGYSSIIQAFQSGNAKAYLNANPQAGSDFATGWPGDVSLLSNTPSISNTPGGGGGGGTISAGPATPSSSSNPVADWLGLTAFQNTAMLLAIALGCFLVGGFWLAKENPQTTNTIVSSAKDAASTAAA